MKRNLLTIALAIFTIFSVSAQRTKKQQVAKTCLSSIEMVTSGYTPGTTVDLTFNFIYSSPDYEYIDAVSLQFPTGVTVNSATKCTEADEQLSYNGETGDGVLASWGNLAGGSNLGDLRKSGEFSVNVTISDSYTGNMPINWVVVGDGGNAEPHSNSGTINIIELIGANITFTVDDGTTPLEKVTLTVDDKNYFTDANGIITTFLPEGENVCTFNLFGYNEETYTVNVLDAVDDNVNISMTELPNYDVNFTVDDFEGNSVEGAEVSIYFETDIIHQGLTDATGKITFSNVYVGNYTYTITKSNLNSIEDVAFSVVDINVNISETLSEPMIEPYLLIVDVVDNEASFSWNNNLSSIKLSQHNGIETVNAYFQKQGLGYGVVFDLSDYPDAVIDKVDFHHSSFNNIDTWEYKFHIADMTNGVAAGVTESYFTEGNDTWELGVDLGQIPGLGGKLVGIFLEPFGNTATDAYPNITADNISDPNSTTLVDVNLTTFEGTQGISAGNLIMDLWILTSEGKSVKVPVYANDTLNQKSTKKFEKYVVYLDGNEVANDLTETSYNFTNLTNGNHVAGVKSVYTTGETEIITKTFTIEGVSVKFIVDDVTNPYPNPSSGLFTVSVNGTYNLQVVNITGKTIFTQKITNTENIKINKSGIYILYLTNEIETLNYKVIVK